MITALAIGHVTLDTYPDGLKVGGSVAYAARTWQALGARTRLITAAGPDFPVAPVAGWQVRPSAQTTRFTNRYDAAGHRQQHLAAQADPLEAPPKSATESGTCSTLPPHDVAFLCPVLQDFEPAPWIAALAGTRLVAAGLQGWLKRAGPDGAVIHGPERAPADFRGLHAAFLSEEDLAGRLDWLDALCSVVPLVYLTRGRAGALLFRADCITRIGTCPAQEVDPTGAGDTFAAATLVALAGGRSPEAAARLGAAAASIAVEHRAAAPVAALRRAQERLAWVA